MQVASQRLSPAFFISWFGIGGNLSHLVQSLVKERATSSLLDRDQSFMPFLHGMAAESTA